MYNANLFNKLFYLTRESENTNGEPLFICGVMFNTDTDYSNNPCLNAFWVFDDSGVEYINDNNDLFNYLNAHNIAVDTFVNAIDKKKT